MKRSVLLFVIVSMFFVACSVDISRPTPPIWIQDNINDSTLIFFPNSYNSEPGQWLGRDTWGYYKSRNDSSVIFFFEEGPGAPYQPRTVSSLADTHFVYPYGMNNPGGPYIEKFYDFTEITTEGNLTIVFYSRVKKELKEKNGLVLIENRGSKTYTEFLFISFDTIAREEVVSILKTISIKNK
jgi:hypothetical protein